MTAADEFLAVSRQALAGASGRGALDALGYWDMLGALDDPDARAAVFALFRAHGRELADTGALGALAAAPYLGSAADAAQVTFAFPRRSVARGTVYVVVGPLEADEVLVDGTADGGDAWIVPRDAVTARAVDVPGRCSLHEVEVDRTRGRPLPGGVDVLAARGRSTFLARLAAAYEILGAAEGAFALALDHANGRVQFGQPIGRFQAVRHLLAWAVTDCRAVEAVADLARDLDTAAPPRVDEIVKALAGRNGRRACERALQVLGGIGFTAELDHHHFHSRVLALDALLGSSAELATALGQWLRTQRPDLGLGPAALLGA